MLTRVNKVLIGKDINRDAQAIAGVNVKTLVAELAEGEVLVLDKYKKVLAAGATKADSDIIYICQATGKTFDFTGETGVSVTGARELIFSDPIQGSKVRSFKAKPYAAATECSTTYVLTATHPVTLGREYIIRLVYTDMEEYPSQFTQTYRYVATSADVSAIDTFGANLAAKINAHGGRRVQATYTSGSDSLAIVGKAIPECTTSVNDIDEYKQVTFKCYFLYVDSNGKWQPVTVTSTTNVAADPGHGTWAQVRDMEKAQFAYKGVSNFTQFPVIKPAFSTVKDSYYDLFVIEHDKEYLSPGINSYQSTTLTTVVAMATASTGINANGQKDSFLGQLNPWMESCGFEQVTA